MPSSASTAPPGTTSIKVAVVEGNQTVRESLSTIIGLAADCCCVGAWESAEEALRCLRQEGFAIPRVILMDLQLPKASAIRHLALLRKAFPQTRLVAVALYEDPDRISQALRAGACGYLLKRSTPGQIIAAIRDANLGAVTDEQSRTVCASKPPHLGR